MYSVVLATMLMAGGETPNWCHSRCHGCYSCYTSCSFCCGGGGCCWASCHGCWSGCHGCWSYGHGCYGCGCCSSYYYGCSSCHGCCSSYGCSVSYGCCSVGCSTGCFSCGHGCGGVIISSAPIHAPVYHGSVAPSVPAVQTVQNVPTPAAGQATNVAANRATLAVSLPAEAKLYVDNVFCPLTGAERTFQTPDLKAGTQYYYTLKIEVERDGQMATENRRVVLTPGQTVAVNFNAPVQTAQR